jgi:hypothetical protein
VVVRVPLVLAGVAIAMALVAPACGGGDGEGGGGREAERDIQADAQERAEAVVLQLSDFPDGWRATAPEEQDEDARNEFRECLGSDYSQFTIVGEAASDDFATGSSAEASSDSTVFATDAEATAAVEERAAELESESINECLQRFMQEAAEGEVEVRDVETGELSFTAPPGIDDANAWQIAIAAEGVSGEGAGVSVTTYLDLVLLREGDTVGQVETFDVLSPFDQELRDELIAAVADRMIE